MPWPLAGPLCGLGYSGTGLLIYIFSFKLHACFTEREYLFGFLFPHVRCYYLSFY